MKLGPDFLKLPGKNCVANKMVNMESREYDPAFKTDNDGNPILLFLGKLDDKGQIKGSRHART